MLLVWGRCTPNWRLGVGPHFTPSLGGTTKKIGKALFSRAPPLPTFFARLDPRRRRRNFFGTQSRLAKMSHSMAWVWGGMSPCVPLASYLRVGAWAPWEAPCTLPWPFCAVGPSEPPQIASGLQNGRGPNARKVSRAPKIGS